MSEPQWTTTAPTVPGWYWWCGVDDDGPDDAAEIVEVYPHADDDHLRVYDGVRDTRLADLVRSVWSGPLVPPPNAHAPDCAVAVSGRHACSCGADEAGPLDCDPPCICGYGHNPECQWIGHNNPAAMDEAGGGGVHHGRNFPAEKALTAAREA